MQGLYNMYAMFLIAVERMKFKKNSVWNLFGCCLWFHGVLYGHGCEQI